ncbi:hypothetical protein [Achromobacter denitrificans]|uniref:Uncharacterized protein n=1 Tax=Achromobacter denitrificans TaxID=32002 RepID=A0A6N0JN10_ACHDE|nr:hypothetical protein [Achromobacter denitrificans]QKQ48469.1 hypothetical protein FOC81_17930 [Achromobacter denitrificans]
MVAESRLSDVIVKMPDRSTCRIERRILRQQGPTGKPVTRFVCSLPTGEQVIWLSEGKYRMPDGSVGVAVAHKLPRKDGDTEVH